MSSSSDPSSVGSSSSAKNIIRILVPSIPVGSLSVGSGLQFDVLTFTPPVNQVPFIPPASTNDPTISDYYNSVSLPQLQANYQQIIQQLEDPALLKGMFVNAQQDMASLRNFIAEIYQYVNTQTQLLKINFNTAISDANSAISSYDLTANTDQQQIAALNNAIEAYNMAQSHYNTATNTYDTAVSAYNTNLVTYNEAVATFQAALITYQNSAQGPTDQQTLAQAQATFDAAQSTFNTQQTTFNTAQTTYDTAQTSFDTAQGQLQAAASVYNTYIATRNTQLNSLITQFNSYNTIASVVNGEIQTLNSIRSTLKPPLPPLAMMPIIPIVTDLPGFSLPTPGSDAAVNQANSDIANFNNNELATYNNSLGTINPLIAQFTPTQPQLSPFLPIPTIPTTDATSNDLSLIVTTNPAHIPTITFTPPQALDIVSIYLDPRLPVINYVNNIKQNQANNNSYYEAKAGLINAEKKGATAGSAASLGGPGSGTAMATVSSDYSGKHNPTVVGSLGRQIYSSFFNFQGVSLGSPVVDQVTQFGSNIAAVNGLTAAAPGAAIIGTSSVNTTSGPGSVSLAVSLGFLKTTSEAVNSDFIASTIQGYLAQDPTLSTLSPAQKQDVTNLLAADLSTSLVSTAISQVARELNLPGLIAQVVANVAAEGQGQGGETQGFSGALFFTSVTLAQNLEKDAGLSAQEAQQISGAILSSLLKTSVSQSALAAQSQVVSAVASALTDYNFSQAQAGALAQKSYEQAQATIQGIQAQEQTQRSAILSNALSSALTSDDVINNGVKANTLIQQLNLGSVLENLQNGQANLANQLQNSGLSSIEANSVATHALNSFNLQDPLQNPLRTSLIQGAISPAELATYFKNEVATRLAPTVGAGNALDAASTYASLLFTDPNSLLNVKARSEAKYSAATNQTYAERLLSDYISSLNQYTNPSHLLATLNDPAKVLLTGGSVGGLETQGMSFMSNNVGQVHYKHPISIEA